LAGWPMNASTSPTSETEKGEIGHLTLDFALEKFECFRRVDSTASDILTQILRDWTTRSSQSVPSRILGPRTPDFPLVSPAPSGGCACLLSQIPKVTWRKPRKSSVSKRITTFLSRKYLLLNGLLFADMKRHSTGYPVRECGSAAIRGRVGLASPHELRRVT